MGRGLSDLQKTILRLAYHNMTTEGRPPSKVTVEVHKLPRQVASDVTKKDLESLPKVGEGVEERIEERQRWREFVESEGPTNLVEQGRYREVGLFAERPKKYREKDHNRYTRRYGWGTEYPTLIRKGTRVAFLDTVEAARDLSESIEGLGLDSWTDAVRTGWMGPGDFYYHTKDVYPPELFVEYYDLSEHQLQPIRDEDGRRRPGNYFDRSGAESEFESASASVARAFRRVEDRGLAVGHGGVRLTKAGAEKGKELIEGSNG